MNKGQIIAPGATIGILGDGQLGKMLAQAAQKLGYKVAVLGPGGRESPTGQVAYWAQAWGTGVAVSDELLDEFCKLVKVVVIEWENIPLSLVERIQAHGIEVCPGIDALKVAQDRILEKSLAASLGIPTTDFAGISSHDAIDRLRAITFPCILKTCRDGYDGKGQVRVEKKDDVLNAWVTLKRVPCILEKVVDFKIEFSVIVARNPSSDGMPYYGPIVNEHEGGILRKSTSWLLGRKHQNWVNRAIDYTSTLANSLDVHGLLAVEYFLTHDNKIIFNEMAPRPHNSGHLTIECSYTSQFEQLIRAACNLPWGSPIIHSPGEMKNILGNEIENYTHLMISDDELSVHIYGKGAPAPGRKMGHSVRHLN